MGPCELQKTLPDSALADAIEKNLKQVRTDESGLKKRIAVLENLSLQTRSVLNGITGFSEVLAQEPTTDQQSDCLGSIKTTSSQAVVLIDNVLEFLRLEAGQIAPEYGRYSLEDLICRVEAVGQAWGQKKAVQVKVTRHRNLPTEIQTDIVYLQQCLLHLAEKLIDYTETGQIRLEINGLKDSVRFDFTNGKTVSLSDDTDFALAVAKEIANMLGGELIFGQSVLSLTVPLSRPVEYISLDNTPQKNKQSDVDTMLADIVVAYDKIL